MGMTIKKIIDGLYFTVGMMLFNPATGEDKIPDELNEDDRYTYDACMGAIELLQAQEPRVMTLEEIPDAVFGWMEVFGQIIPCVLEDVYADDTVGFANVEDGHDYMCASDYGKTWRCWTSCPTDEQMEATPWN